MDIHKPKAAHSLREFATEIGTIICGILIALALEQAVEAAHRGSEVREAREALRADISRNLTVLQGGVRADECSLKDIDRYTAWANGGPKPTVAKRPYPYLLDSVWETSKPAVALMQLEERARFARFYGLVANYNSLVEHQRAAAWRIGEFFALEKLRLEDRPALLFALQNYRMLAATVQNEAETMRQFGETTGARAEPMPPEWRRQMEAACRMADAAPPGAPG